MVAERSTCGLSWHRDLVKLSVQLLEGHAFSVNPEIVGVRDRMAKLLAAHDEFDYHGWGDDPGPEPAAAVTPARATEDAAPPVPDFRTRDQQLEDRYLEGVWWRCPMHGVSGDAITLNAVAYCRVDGCNQRVLAVGSFAWERRR
jgi:hypothetical protein